MSTPILATKLYIPPPRPKVVLRPRLIERLNDGLHRRLTLISAPAGFGKTTLVSEWIAGAGDPWARQVAWLSLDAGDNDPLRFLTHLIAALQTVAANFGEGILGMLQSTQPPPAESLLTPLLNEMIALPAPFILVLDDYHVIETQATEIALTFLIEHLPPQMHLIITTREDPHLPLARLRTQGQLTELRAADLRFTAAEAAAFLNQVMNLSLSAADIAALEERTEGWIAGLQLAALAVQGTRALRGTLTGPGHQDVSRFIRTFAGDHRYVADYLVEEVLQRQPEPVRNFLLQTAILDRLNGSLCDAVTGQQEGSARLETLQRGNYFVVPLDDKRHWYRYHHLFAEVLQAYLRAEQPELVPTLHRRASQWYAQHDLPVDAIRHALVAGDFAHAAELIELTVPIMRRSRQEATMLGWFQALPDDVVRCRPVLNVYYAGTLLQSGELQGVETRLRDAERWLETTAELGEQPQSPSEMIVVDREEFRQLPSWIAIYRAGQALIRGHLNDTLQHAQRALDLAPEDEYFGRGAAAALLGLAYWASGELEAAYRTYAAGMASVQRAGYISDAVGGAIALADIRTTQGRLREAMRIYMRGLQLAAEQPLARTGSVLRGTADMYVGMSEIEREQNDLTAATQHLLQSRDLGEHTGFPQHPYRWRVAMARIREAQGDWDGALDLLDEAERLYVSDFYPNVRPIAALKARVWVAQGRLGDALGWAHEQNLSVHDELSFLREFEHITLARVLLARSQRNRSDHSLSETVGLLDRLGHAAAAGGRTGSVIEILVLQALAYQLQGDIPAALAPLERALTLAEPEGYVRIFVDRIFADHIFADRIFAGGGPPMAHLLRKATARGILPDYAGKLLAACDGVQQRGVGESLLPSAPTAHPLIEPLSQRELDVLRLFKTELSGPEIAQELVIALSTVRTHTKSIYSKLNVTNRRAAVRRAAELNLI